MFLPALVCLFLCLSVCLSLTVCLSVSVYTQDCGGVGHGTRTSRFNFGRDPIVMTERKPWGGGLHSLGAMSTYLMLLLKVFHV